MTLRTTEVVLPAAPVGEENPLPPLRPSDELHSLDALGAFGGLPADMAARVRYGRLPGVLPYHMQDGYSRSRTLTQVPAIELANDRLRATVLPGLGGRLHSLVHVPTGRELLYRNPALQPANLALRNAWFAGGVEWNLGSTGHTTLTCSPLHAARLTGADGSPLLRLWEWERTRDLPYQLDFWLPPGVDALLVGVRVRNPHGSPVPAYWWSNAAVPQEPDARVLVPASSAWRFGYERGLERVPIPVCDGVDVSHPASHRRAVDLFFEVPADQRPWIAAVDGRGRGVAQLSTGRLRGRKLFVWGQSAGGRRWQEWLSPSSPSPGYFEIQAGLATTQFEHLPMPAGASWHWVEAYLPVEGVDAGGSWDSACRAVDEALEAALPSAILDREHADWLPIADSQPGEALFAGSGWGALELERARKTGSPIELPGTPFGPGTLGASQRPWLELIDGAMPDADAGSPPGGTLVSAPWRALLERATDSWLVSYHRGVARWHAGDKAGAIAAWRHSVGLRPSTWALRNLAVALAGADEGEHDRMLNGEAELMRAALELRPDCLPLRIETAQAMVAAGNPADALSLLERHTWHGRCQLLRAQALLALGNAAGAQAVFDFGFEVADLREGEETLTELWFAVQRALGSDRPLPARYDFRMG